MSPHAVVMAQEPGQSRQSSIAVEPFDALATSYDPEFTATAIGRAQRAQVARELDRCFHAGDQILELNCGTGHDALALAGRGIHVTAFDASPAMISVAKGKLDSRLESPPELADVRFEVLRNEDLRLVSGTFDGAFSNFAGLNCSSDWRGIASELRRLVRPGGSLLLCVMGRTCLWEFVSSILAAKPCKAARRFFRSSTARIGGTQMEVYYPSVGDARRAFAPGFALHKWCGIGAFVPPSYLNERIQNHPRTLALLQALDLRLSHLPVIRNLADHILLHFVRTEL